MSQKTLAKTFLALLFFAVLAGAPLAHAAQLININTADKAALATLNGIADVKAQAVIDYRAANGPFVKIEDIVNVKGIGPVTFSKIKDFITVSSTSTVQAAAASSTQIQAQPQISAQVQSVVSATPPNPIKKKPVLAKVVPPENPSGGVLGESTSSTPAQSGGNPLALWGSLAALGGLLAAGGAGAYYVRPRRSPKETPLTAEEFEIE
jgi:competence ComEA-like helix-hairpin-helix protein